jgi:hypothetical protein
MRDVVCDVVDKFQEDDGTKNETLWNNTIIYNMIAADVNIVPNHQTNYGLMEKSN